MATSRESAPPLSAAVVVAGGSGRRLGGVPKQFRHLRGRPVLAWACEALRAHPAIRLLVVVLPADVAADPPGWVGPLADVVVAGGDTRRESVGLGVAALRPEVERVLVHDGVRPFATRELVDRVWAAAVRGAVVPVLPLPDTVKRVDGGRVVRTLRRERLVRVQTPQGFPAGLLRRVHSEAAAAGEEAPDDAALCERRGEPVWTVPGDPRNLKITTEEDLAWAAWVAAEREPGCDTAR